MQAAPSNGPSRRRRRKADCRRSASNSLALGARVSSPREPTSHVPQQPFDCSSGHCVCAGCAAPCQARARRRGSSRLRGMTASTRCSKARSTTTPCCHLGFIDLTSQVNGMRCVGQLRVVELPPSAPRAARAAAVRRVWESSSAAMVGRSALSGLAKERCGEGSGKGKDSVGAELHFAFGMSLAQQQSVTADALREQKRKPFLPTPPPAGENQTAARAPSSGTAFFVASDGKLVTNHHVVSGAQRIEVVLNEQETFEARLVPRRPHQRSRDPRGGRRPPSAPPALRARPWQGRRGLHPRVPRPKPSGFGEQGDLWPCECALRHWGG